jgi:hypothetical protein|tara:strand:- start:6316 stop:6810 length:495 start_codon:yes stop_codon:yes gene_type:complete
MGVVSKASIKNKLRQSQARYFDDLADSVATLTDGNTFTGIQTLSANLVANAGFVLGLQTVVAAGSDQAGAGAITAQGGAVVLCSTADNTKGIRLPVLSSVSVGEVYLILNNLSNKTLEVYPGSGDAINPVSDNGAVTIAADTMLICIAQDAVQWFSGELPVTAA